MGHRGELPHVTALAQDPEPSQGPGRGCEQTSGSDGEVGAWEGQSLSQNPSLTPQPGTGAGAQIYPTDTHSCRHSWAEAAGQRAEVANQRAETKPAGAGTGPLSCPASAERSCPRSSAGTCRPLGSLLSHGCSVVF